MAAKDDAAYLIRLAHEYQREIDRAANRETTERVIVALRAGAMALIQKSQREEPCTAVSADRA